MQIPFTGFADDCTIAGEIDMLGDRLSDFLASSAELQVEHATLRALDDGHVVKVDSAKVFREDLCIVTATGPRGRADRRLLTRKRLVRVRVGPYLLLGYLHAPPTIDPLQTTARRTIVALTDSVVEYAEGDENVRVDATAVLVNQSKIERLERATSEELGVARHVDLVIPLEPRARDLTDLP